MLSRLIAAALLAAAAPDAASAAVTLYRFDVTVVNIPGNAFSAPIFDYYNLSSPGVTISTARISGGPPWDYILNRPAPANIVNPTGGSRILLEGQEASSDRNDGCTAGIKYGFTGFDAGDTFHFGADPEAPGCGSAVVDLRPFLTGDKLVATVEFNGGVTLSGHDWTVEYFNPAASHTDPDNQRYRLTLQTSLGEPDPPPPSPPMANPVPEPATWALLIAGFGLAGARLRRSRVAAYA